MKHSHGADAPKREVRSFAAGSDLEIRVANDGSKKLTGYAIRFGQPAFMEFTEYVAPTAINRTLLENPDVLLLRDHKQELLLARTTAGNLTLTVDGNNGLRFSADLIDTTTANDAYKDIKAGLLTGMSFGFVVRDDKWEQDADGSLKRTLLDIDLFEISATSFPAYQSSSVDARSIRAKLNRRDDDPDNCPDDELDEDGNCPGDSDEDESDRTNPVCQCRCERCVFGEHTRCYNERCEDASCRTSGCPAPTQDEQRADSLRIRSLFAHRVAAN